MKPIKIKVKATAKSRRTFLINPVTRVVPNDNENYKRNGRRVRKGMRDWADGD